MTHFDQGIPFSYGQKQNEAVEIEAKSEKSKGSNNSGLKESSEDRLNKTTGEYVDDLIARASLSRSYAGDKS